VFENSVSGKSITQISGEMEVNQAFCDMLGYTRPELINRRWQEITHPEDVELTQAMVGSLMSGEKEIVRFTKRYIHKNGSIVWADVGTALRRDPAGQPLYLVTSINDITDRKLAEEKLRESETRYHLIFENSGTANTIFDMDCRVVLQNSQSQELTMPADAFGKTALEVFGPDQGPIVNERMRRVQASGVAEVFETKFSMPAGTKWIRSSYQPLFDDKHAVVGIQVISQDISVQKQAEEALRDYNTRLATEVTARTRELTEAQEKLVRQERLATLGQLAGSVGHELRNPMNCATRWASFRMRFILTEYSAACCVGSMLLQNLYPKGQNSVIPRPLAAGIGILKVLPVYYLKMTQPDANATIRDYLDIIEKETRSSDKIVTDLLDFTRLKSVNREPADISELVRQTLIRYPVPDSVEVTLDLPVDLPTVYADPGHVVQVLGNLVTNACQAMALADETPQPGKINLSARQQGDMIAITVQDTGTGIPPENMGKLFEPLFTTKTKGIGLGLAVSQRLIEANDGRIEARSEPGKGSTFTIHLPVFRS
jgi:PAS domain S-box-containing protein